MVPYSRGVFKPSVLEQALLDLEERELMAEAHVAYLKKYGKPPRDTREDRRRFAAVKRKTKYKRGRRDNE